MPSSRTVDRCPHCDAKMVKYRHGLTIPLIRGLNALAVAGGGPINLNQLDLDRNEWDNFQKLRYFVLVYQVEVDGKHQKGVWKMTDIGWDFLLGRLSLPKTAITYRGEVVDWDGPKVFVHEVDGFYVPREEWAERAIPNG